MAICFVIQPFDHDKFDRRYEDIFVPAIKAAGIDPYRVDRDPGVNIPIDEIEKGIKDAIVCFAEITEDNPNVWFELGYTIALDKPVCMICSKERKTKFPFDVQHRSIIPYDTGSTSDYKKLENDITERLKALIIKKKELNFIAEMPSLTQIEGLCPHETTALTIIMSSKHTSEGGPSVHMVKEDMRKVGFTDLTASLSLEILQRKGLIELFEAANFRDEPYTACRCTEAGIQWLLQNQDKFLLRPRPPLRRPQPQADSLIREIRTSY